MIWAYILAGVLVVGFLASYAALLFRVWTLEKVARDARQSLEVLKYE